MSGYGIVTPHGALNLFHAAFVLRAVGDCSLRRAGVQCARGGTCHRLARGPGAGQPVAPRRRLAGRAASDPRPNRRPREPADRPLYPADRPPRASAGGLLAARPASAAPRRDEGGSPSEQLLGPRRARSAPPHAARTSRRSWPHATSGSRAGAPRPTFAARPARGRLARLTQCGSPGPAGGTVQIRRAADPVGVADKRWPMRVILADVRSNRGFVSKDTIVGGYGSRLDPFSRVTTVMAWMKRQFNDLPSVHMAYLAAILARAGHDVRWTRGELIDGDVALVLSSLVDYKNETAWADALRARGVKVG